MAPLPPDPDAPQGERLQKFLSAAGVASRRHSEDYIRQGRVRVNGEIARLGMRVLPDDIVEVDGVRVGPDAPVYLLLNKPLGTVTTLDDPQGRPTVADLVPAEPRTYPVGRLDIDTSGLIVMTNDGELAHRLMHPRWEIDKTYEALVRGTPTREGLRMLRDGVRLPDEERPTSPAEVELIQQAGSMSLVRVTIHEGRNRQVRRMFDAIGTPVAELVRSGYAHLRLGDLKPGQVRELDRRDVRKLRRAVGLARGRRDR